MPCVRAGGENGPQGLMSRERMRTLATYVREAEIRHAKRSTNSQQTANNCNSNCFHKVFLGPWQYLMVFDGFSRKFAGPLAQGVLDPLIIPCPVSLWSVPVPVLYTLILL